MVEYDFKKLDIESEFTKQLYPVIYREEREDISKVLQLLFDVAVQGKFHPLLRLLFYKNLVRHISWSYEREWRLLILENENLVELPLEPTAIYITDRCNVENESLLKMISQKLNCKLIRLTPTKNNISFIFNETLVEV